MPAVVIPWRGGCPHREAALQWVLGQYGRHHPGWSVFIGEHVDGEWCKARAAEDALSSVTDATLVVADADVWTDLSPAVKAVEDGSPWAIPHKLVHRFDLSASKQIINGEEPSAGLPHDQRPYRGYEGGGVVVLPTDTYREVPLDVRFTGFGQEDESWALALRTMVGVPQRFNAPLWHLWHPPQPRQSRGIGNKSGMRLHKRYKFAYANPPIMRLLLDGMHEAEVLSR